MVLQITMDHELPRVHFLFDPMQAFVADLEKFITSLTLDKNHDDILGMYAYELYDKTGESAILDLADFMASMNYDYPPPPLRRDSKRIVDFIVATAGIHQNIIRYGMLPKD
jgi:hypothetical protein